MLHGILGKHIGEGGLITSFLWLAACMTLGSFGIFYFLSWTSIYLPNTCNDCHIFFVATTWLYGSCMLGSSLLACSQSFLSFKAMELLIIHMFWDIFPWFCVQLSFLMDVCWSLVCTTMLLIPYLCVISHIKTTESIAAMKVVCSPYMYTH